MFNSIDFDKLLYLFTYDQWDPLLFSSSLFLFLFFGLLILNRAVSFKKSLRIIVLIAFSLFFYYKVTGVFFLVIVYTTIVNYAAGIGIKDTDSKIWKKVLFIYAIVVNLFLLGYFKYTNFFIEIINDVNIAALDPIDILLPIGISFYTFKAISYLVDIYWGILEPEKNFLDFTLYITFFANVLAGPIDRARNFLPQVKKDYHISSAQLGTALYLIASGLIKKGILADYISINFVERVFDSPLRYTGAENILAVYGYALEIYLDFSGYTDMALGIALLLGFKLMENFNQPYKATSVADFWRRWHISLSNWLLDYLFRPLQMKFRNLRLAGNALAIFITFILCGLWHGADWTFVFWGTVHGFFMGVALLVKKPKSRIYDKLKLSNTKILKFAQIFITFHLVAIAWVFFRAATFQDAIDVFRQIFEFLQPEVFPQFVVEYQAVFIFMVVGYILHFLPLSWAEKTQNMFIKSPVIVKALLLTIVIWLVIQARSAELQPYIYFQF